VHASVWFFTLTAVDLYRDPVVLARVEELMRLNKADLITTVRGLPNIHTRRALDRWRKVELAWTIVCVEHDAAAREP
jgi:hypothetical protein